MIDYLQPTNLIASVNTHTWTADLVTFTEEILNGKLHFLCSVVLRKCLKLVIYGCLKICLFYSQDPNLLKSGMSQNQPKPAKTTRNQKKRPPKIVKQPETSQIFKIGEIWNFLLAFVFQTSSPNPQIWVFGPRSINIPCCLHPISKVVISNLALLFEVASPNAQIWAF